MNWKAATLTQLYVIAYDDPMARPVDKIEAHEEIKRRIAKKRIPRKSDQYRIERVYPR